MTAILVLTGGVRGGSEQGPYSFHVGHDGLILSITVQLRVLRQDGEHDYLMAYMGGIGHGYLRGYRKVWSKAISGCTGRLGP